MNAIPGGKAPHDPIDAQHRAALRRGGRLPPADVDPAARRATRAGLRRRCPRPRHRAERLPPGQPTTWPYHLPALGQPLAYQANRGAGAARFAEPAVPKRVAGALALLASDDPRRRAVEGRRVQTATQHQAQTRYRLPSVLGSGTLGRLGLR